MKARNIELVSDKKEVDTKLQIQEGLSDLDWKRIKDKALIFISSSRKTMVVANEEDGYSWDDFSEIFRRLIEDEEIENALIDNQVIGKLRYAHNYYGQTIPRLTMVKAPAKKKFGWSDWTKPQK